ncbi:MAG TPA: hypothetical protein VFE47_28255 [Tepidisphaeraceae bacterium]|jgi:hypothetical protein|nr:hypothetical protein [Tepidisphaeraceae bacterium]
MKAGVILIVSALAVFVIAVGCSIFPGPENAGTKSTVTVDTDPLPVVSSAKLEGLPLRGIVLQVQRIDSPEIYYKAIDDIAAVGADTVEIVVDSKQENAGSNIIFVDVRQTPTLEKLEALIEYAHSKNLRVVLMPIVLLERPRSTEWRGVIKPDSWDDWFESYRGMVTHYAEAAEKAHANVLVVGSELVSTERYKDEWVRTINATRQVYHGMMTYSANWDHYRTIPFWDHLDLIATNSYYKLGENKDVSVAEIVSRWRAIQKDLLPWVKSQHKPYMFTEVGWCSMANAAHEPWDYTKDAAEVPLDLELQKKLYEGFFQAWDGIPELGGYMFWQWVPNGGGPEDRGYTPKGKPAERVLRQEFAKPRWTVTP